LRTVLERAATPANAASGDLRRLGDSYASCMDSTHIEQLGAKPLDTRLRDIAALASPRDVMTYVFSRHAAGETLLFTFGAGQDAVDSRQVIFEVGQGGLGFPDREYYTRTDSAAVQLRTAYLSHIAAMLRLTNMDSASALRDAQQVMGIEQRLAQASLNRLQRRDPKALYHPMKLDEAQGTAPRIDWAAYLKTLGRGDLQSLNVSNPAFFAALSVALDSVSVDAWRAYLRVHTAKQAAPYLSSAFVREEFAFQSRLTGTTALLPRWRRCLAFSDRYLTDALAREYVRTAYPPAAKASMDQMITNILAVYADRLRTREWMDEPTRREALRKLDRLGRKVGYPTTWRSYAGLTVSRSDWFGNATRAVAFDNQADLRKIGRPVSATEWRMTPPTVNAYYDAQNNEIAFPAGRLQPPFFHPTFDLAANYGGIGATIGHEISHGFDDQGRQYDADGNLRDWWTPADAERFAGFASRFTEQYGAYRVLDSLPLNGRQTLGENIADNAGVAIAYEALQRALRGQPRAKIDGFTPEQRFFLGWAQARRQIWRDAALRLSVQTGVHAPGVYRVNGPLVNMPEFAEAFGCKAGDRMVRDSALRTRMW
jgi:putative endopeptidase